MINSEPSLRLIYKISLMHTMFTIFFPFYRFLFGSNCNPFIGTHKKLLSMPKYNEDDANLTKINVEQIIFFIYRR